MNQTVSYSEEVACDRCGKYGAYEFDEVTLCLDCYESRGSCCPEFGKDDLLPDPGSEL